VNHDPDGVVCGSGELHIKVIGLSLSV
jgi:hypothetical protein